MLKQDLILGSSPNSSSKRNSHPVQVPKGIMSLSCSKDPPHSLLLKHTKSSSKITRQCNWSIMQLTDIRFTRNDGTCRTDDNVSVGMQGTEPVPMMSWDVPSAFTTVASSLCMLGW